MGNSIDCRKKRLKMVEDISKWELYSPRKMITVKSTNIVLDPRNNKIAIQNRYDIYSQRLFKGKNHKQYLKKEDIILVKCVKLYLFYNF